MEDPLIPYGLWKSRPLKTRWRKLANYGQKGRSKTQTGLVEYYEYIWHLLSFFGLGFS